MSGIGDYNDVNYLNELLDERDGVEKELKTNKIALDEELANATTMQRADEAVKRENAEKRVKRRIEASDLNNPNIINSALDNQQAMYQEYVDTLKDKSKVDDYVKAGMSGQPINLLDEVSGDDYNRQAYINMRVKNSRVNHEDYMLGKWDPRINQVYDKDWKDGVRYSYVPYDKGTLGGQHYQGWNESGYISKQDGEWKPIDVDAMIKEDPYIMLDPMNDKGSANFTNPGFVLFNKVMKEWKDNGVPDALAQEQAFREVYGAEYDHRMKEEGTFARNAQDFLKAFSLGYSMQGQEFLPNRSNAEKYSRVISTLGGHFTPFAGAMGLAKKGTSIAFKGAQRLFSGKKVANTVSAAQQAKTATKLDKVADWVRNAKTGRAFKNTINSVVGFNLHGQAYKQPDGSDIYDRINRIGHDSIMGLAFGLVGSLNLGFEASVGMIRNSKTPLKDLAKHARWVKRARAAEYPLMFAIGYNMADDESNPMNETDKWVHGLLFMAMHGVGHRMQRKNVNKIKKEVKENLTDIHKRTAIASKPSKDPYSAKNQKKLNKAIDEVFTAIEAAPSEAHLSLNFTRTLYKNILNKTEPQYRAWKAREAKKRKAEEAKQKQQDPKETVNGKPVGVQKETKLDETAVPMEQTPTAAKTGSIPELESIKKRVLAIEKNPSKAPPLSEATNEIADLRNNLAEGYVLRDGEVQPVTAEEAMEIDAQIDALEKRAADAQIADKKKVQAEESAIEAEAKALTFTEDEILDLGEGPISPKTGRVLKQFDRKMETEEQANAQIARLDEWIEKSEDKLAEYNEGTVRHENLQEQIDEAVAYRDNIYDLVESKKLDNEVVEAEKSGISEKYEGDDLPLTEKQEKTLKKYTKVDKSNQAKLAKESKKPAKKELDKVSVSEGFDDAGMEIKTGEKATFNYLHNPKSSPNMGKTFQQDIEPSGKYMTLKPSGDAVKGMETGTQTFENPLVIETSINYDNNSWKKKLSDQYGKTGQELTDALIKDGYDGIVTTYKASDGNMVPGEIVSLKPVESKPVEDTFDPPEGPTDAELASIEKEFEGFDEADITEADKSFARMEENGLFGNKNFFGTGGKEYTRKQKFEDAARVAGHILGKGIKNFAQFSKEMLKKLGDAIRPYLDRLFKSAKAYVKDYMAHPRMGASIQMVGKDGKPLTAKQRKALQAKMAKETVKQATEVPKEIMESAVTRLSNKNIRELKEPIPQFNNVSDLSKHLTQRALKIQKELGINLREDSPQANEIVAQVLASEIKAENEREWNADGWYSEKMQGAVRIATGLYPQMKDPIKKTAFNFGLAITSNGQGVPTNSRIAMQQFEYYLENGRWDENFGKNISIAEKQAMGAGKEMPAMRKAFKLYNELAELWGESNLQKFLNTDFTVKELRDAGIKSINDELTNTVVKGSTIFGPKVGGAFFQNVEGNFDPLTMDLHFTRTMKRIIGDLLPEAGRGKEFGRDYTEQIKNFKNVIRSNKSARERFGITTEVLKDDAALIDIAKQLHREYARGGYKKKTLLNKRAKNLDAMVNEPKEAPRTGTERNRYRAIMARVVEISGEKSIADAQAKLWFPQKRLYGQFGIKGESINETDYRAEFINIARERGLDDKRIKQLLEGQQLGVVGKGGIKVVRIKENKPFKQLTEAEKEAVLNNDVEYFRNDKEIDSLAEEVLGTMGMGPFTPANMKLLARGLVDSGKWVYNDLPVHIRKQADRVGINSENISDFMGNLKEAPKKVANILKKIFNHMRNWWKNRESKYKDWREEVDRRGSSIDKADLNRYTLKRNRIIHLIEGNLEKYGSLTKRQKYDMRKKILGTKSLADIMKKDAEGNVIDNEADIKLNTYIKALRTLETTQILLDGQTNPIRIRKLVMKSQQVTEAPDPVMVSHRAKQGEKIYPRTIKNHRDYKLQSKDLIEDSKAPTGIDIYDGSKSGRNAVLYNITSTEAWADLVQQKLGVPVYDIIEEIRWNMGKMEEANQKELSEVFGAIPDLYLDKDYIGSSIFGPRKLFDWRKLDKTRRMRIHAAGQGRYKVEDLPESDQAILKSLQKFYSSPKQREKIMLLRFNEWQLSGSKPKGVKEYDKQNDTDTFKDLQETLDNLGYDAFEERLKEISESLLVTQNYMPNLSHIESLEGLTSMPSSVKMRSSKSATKSRAEVGATHEGDAFENFARKIRQQNRLYYLEPSVKKLRDIHDIGDLPVAIRKQIKNYITEIYSRPDDGAGSQYFNHMFTGLMRAVTAQPAKVLRNLTQPITFPFAYLPVKGAVGFTKHYLNKFIHKGPIKITKSKRYEEMDPEVKDYFFNVVANDKAWDEEFVNMASRGILDRMGKLGEYIKGNMGAYKWSDTSNRFSIYDWAYHAILNDLQHAHKTGLDFNTKAKGFHIGGSLRESLLWDGAMNHYASLKQMLRAEIDNAIVNGNKKSMKFAAMRMAHVLAGPMINWEYHRTGRTNIERNNPSWKPALRLWTFPRSLTEAYYRDFRNAYRGYNTGNQKQMFEGMKSVLGRVLSMWVIENIVLNGLAGFRDEEGKYGWGYRFPDAIIYAPGEIQMDQIKIITEGAQAIFGIAFSPFSRDKKAIDEFSKFLESTSRSYIPYYALLAQAMQTIVGKDKVKPILELTGTPYRQKNIDRRGWSWLMHLVFGAGYENPDKKKNKYDGWDF